MKVRGLRATNASCNSMHSYVSEINISKIAQLLFPSKIKKFSLFKKIIGTIYTSFLLNKIFSELFRYFIIILLQQFN